MKDRNCYSTVETAFGDLRAAVIHISSGWHAYLFLGHTLIIDERVCESLIEGIHFLESFVRKHYAVRSLQWHSDKDFPVETDDNA